MDENWALYLGIPVLVSSDPPTIYALDGCILSKILHATAPVSLTISGNHPETILIFCSPLAPIILEHPCLTWHNPQFNLVEGTILSWGLSCKESCLGLCLLCLLFLCFRQSLVIFQVSQRSTVICERCSVVHGPPLPPYWPYDCRIDLVPGSMPPCGRLYSLSFPECETFERYLADLLAAGAIVPSTSPARVLFREHNYDVGNRELNTLALFQALVNIVLRDMLNIFIFVYLDDILIFFTFPPGRRPARASCATTSVGESSFWRSAFFMPVLFLGSVVSADGISVDPAKVRAVIYWPVPDSHTALQRFLGFANFYHHFIHNFSQVAAPLMELTSTKSVSRGPMQLRRLSIV